MITPRKSKQEVLEQLRSQARRASSPPNVVRENGGVWLFVEGIGSFVGTEKEIPKSWGVYECAEHIQKESR